MNLIIVTNPELGWNCVVEVYDASKISEDDVKKLHSEECVTHYTGITKAPKKKSPELDNKDIEAMQEYAKMKCKELLEIVAEKAKVKTEKKSQYGKYRKWQKVKDGEEFDLFDYTMRNSVDKVSILNAIDLETFCS